MFAHYFCLMPMPLLDASMPIFAAFCLRYFMLMLDAAMLRLMSLLLFTSVLPLTLDLFDLMSLRLRADDAAFMPAPPVYALRPFARHVVLRAAAFSDVTFSIHDMMLLMPVYAMPDVYAC